MSTRIGIIGWTGRLGGLVGEQAERSGVPVTLRADSTAWHVDGPPPDVLVDASRPVALASVARYARHEGVPLVTAVSGYDDAQRRVLREVAEDVPVVHVTNLSAGHRAHRALARTLLEQSRRVEGLQGDMSVVDRHPTYKKDAPSATALALREALRIDDSTAPQIFSIRGGMPVCEHEVVLSTFDEEIVITHRVRDWSAYAPTALRLALWLAQRSTPGLRDANEALDHADSRGDHADH